MPAPGASATPADETGMPETTISQVGLRRPRTDGRAKVVGATRYAGDLDRRGLLHARIVPAIHAHARIGAIDRSTALDVPGVVAVLTASDLPVVGSGPQRRFEPLAIDEIVYAGQPVALVVARTEEAAEDAAALVRVDEEPLTPVVDLLGALDPAAPLIRLHVRAGAEPQPAFEPGDPLAVAFSANLVGRTHDQRGDMDAVLADCDVIVEGAFRAPWAYQAYLEPHSATAWLEPDGTLAVTASTQALFATRNNLAAIFGLPVANVRVTGAPVGGGFGSKQTVIEPLVAGACARASCTRQAGADPARGLRLDEAGPGNAGRGPDRRDPGRSPSSAPGPGRLRHRRIPGVVLPHGRGAAPGRPVPLGRLRRRRAWRSDEPLRGGQLPRSDRPAAHPGARDAGRRAGRPGRGRPR